MATELSSNAEKKASAALSLPSFPINLLEIKRTVKSILSQFGKNLIFQEYTTHDISHVDDMLVTLDWLIPPDTQAVLSKGEPHRDCRRHFCLSYAAMAGKSNMS